MRWLPSCLLVGLALTACSSPSDDPSDDPPEVDRVALARGLSALFVGDHDAGDDDSGACFAEELLSTTTPEELREGGLLDASYAVREDLPALADEELAGRVADAQLACRDYYAAAGEAQAAISKGERDGAAFAACLEDALPEDRVRAAVVATLLGRWDDPALGRLTDAQAACSRE